MNDGGYVVHPEIGEEEKKIFDSAMKGHMGIGLEPVAVISSVAAGVNYLFLCTGRLAIPHPDTQLYAVEIFTKLPCNPGPNVELKAIHEIDPAKIMSTYKLDGK